MSTLNVATVNATTALNTAAINGGQLAGFRNKLINGGMVFNQRGAASSADDTYAFDRWNILTQTGTVAASQVTDAEDGTPYMMRITQSQASAQRFGAEQIIEAANSKLMRGDEITLSARVRCSASTDLRYAILEWTGTADSVTSDVVNDWTSGTYTAGNFFLGSNLTVTGTGSTSLTANTLADITALTVTLGSSGNNIIVLFWTSDTQAQNVTLDISNVQLESGDTATPFEQRGIEAELSLCQRYYEKSYGIGTPAGSTAGDITAGLVGGTHFYSNVTPCPWSVVFKVKKRTTPTIQYWDRDGNLSKHTTIANSSTITDNVDGGANMGPLGIGEHGFLWYVGDSAGGQKFSFIHYAASAEL